MSGNFNETLQGGYEQSPSSDEGFADHLLRNAQAELRVRLGLGTAEDGMGVIEGHGQERFHGYPVVKEPFDSELDAKIAQLGDF